MSQDIVRVLRVVEYVGERALVERQVAGSLHGEKILQLGRLRIKAVTVGTYPEILDGLPQVDHFGEHPREGI